MATPSSVAKRAAQQTAAILEAVEKLTAEVAAMKVTLSHPEIAELETPAAPTGEIIAAIGGASVATGKQLERAIDVLAKIAGEVIIIKSEIAELKALAYTPPKPAATRKAKK